ncbi:MAG: hypothetical protein ACQETL_16055 [Bacteroidota bacterium]
MLGNKNHKNVIYALSHMDEWIEFAIQMHKSKGWNPVYWISAPSFHDVILSNFPNCTIHSYVDIVKQESVNQNKLFQPYGIGQEIYRDYADIMYISLKMMDRMDSINKFSFEERKLFFNNLLNYSFNVLREFQPEIALFYEIPHHVTQYVLYSVLKRNGVSIILLKPNSLITIRTQIFESIDDNPVKKYKKLGLSKEISHDELNQIDNYISNLNTEYNKALPNSIKKLQRKQSLYKTLPSALKNIFFKIFSFSFFLKNDQSRIIKISHKSIYNSHISQFENYLLKYKTHKFKMTLKKKYQKVSINNPDLTKKYIYFPLHYQPERTTSPDAGFYSDQISLIQMLSGRLGPDFFIYIKEHKSQFHPQRNGHQSRSLIHYEELLRIKNVRLINLNYDPFELIDNSYFTATLVGTVGLEAVARNKWVAVFGEGCWYKSLDGTKLIRDNNDFEEFLNLVESNNLEDGPNFLRKFLIDYYKTSFHAAVLPQYRQGLSIIENQESLIKEITRFAERTID